MRELFHPGAYSEAQNAIRHYKSIYKQLGADFGEDLEVTVSRILKNPEAWHPLKKGYRRCLLKNFPFGVIYRVDEQKNVCLIYAIMHTSRKPGYWKPRKF